MQSETTESDDNAMYAVAAVSMRDDDFAASGTGCLVPAWAIGSIFDRLAAFGEIAEPTCLQGDE